MGSPAIWSCRCCRAKSTRALCSATQEMWMSPQGPLDGRHILVVEDDYLVAEILCELLADAGAAVLGPIGWANEALAYVELHAGELDGAILDVNLHGEAS